MPQTVAIWVTRPTIYTIFGRAPPLTPKKSLRTLEPASHRSRGIFTLAVTLFFVVFRKINGVLYTCYTVCFVVRNVFRYIAELHKTDTRLLEGLMLGRSLIAVHTHSGVLTLQRLYRGADKSLARPRRKQATATEDFDVHISYL